MLKGCGPSCRAGHHAALAGGTGALRTLLGCERSGESLGEARGAG